MDFKNWMLAVDELIEAETGLRSGDLADANYYDSWNDGLTPADMVEFVLTEEGYGEDTEAITPAEIAGFARDNAYVFGNEE